MSGRKASCRPQLTQLWFSKKTRWSQWSQWKIRIAATIVTETTSGAACRESLQRRLDRDLHRAVLARLEGVEREREVRERESMREQRPEIDAAVDEQRQRGLRRVGVGAIA